MIERRTVFVLGAGASEPYGFPFGRGLVDEAIRVLRKEKGQLNQMLQQACMCSAGDLAALGAALERAMPPSIDRFLEGRPEYLEMGKAVIAALLIPHEDENELFTREDDPGMRRRRRWYDYALNRMAGGKADDFLKNNLSVLTFNYDRSYEHFMLIALQNRYPIGSNEAAKLMEAMPVIHLHGRLGALGAAGTDADTRSYSPTLTPELIQAGARGINVIHEDIGHYPQFARAGELIRAADQVWFLGVGYDPVNAQRLGRENFILTSTRSLTLWGTSYGLAGAERERGMGTIGTVFTGIGTANQDVLTFLRERWV